MCCVSNYGMQKINYFKSIESASEGKQSIMKANLCLSEQRPVEVGKSLEDLRANQEEVVEQRKDSLNRLRTEAQLVDAKLKHPGQWAFYTFNSTWVFQFTSILSQSTTAFLVFMAQEQQNTIRPTFIEYMNLYGQFSSCCDNAVV